MVLAGYGTDLRDQGIQYLKDLMHQVGLSSDDSVVSQPRDHRPSKRQKRLIRHRHLGLNLLDDSSDESGDEDADGDRLKTQVERELFVYMSYKLDRVDKDILYQQDVRKRTHQNRDVHHDVGALPWWKHQQKRFPILSRAARSILCIPASSSMSECVFSASGSTVCKKRTLLKPSTVDMLMFLRSNKDILNRSVV